MSVPTWGIEASPYPLRPSLLPGNPLYLSEAVRSRKAGLSCGYQPRTLLERLWFSGLWQWLASVRRVGEWLLAIPSSNYIQESPLPFIGTHRDLGGGKLEGNN